MGRMRGERAQDYAARRQFEFFARLPEFTGKIATVDGLTIAIMEPIICQVACPCSFRPYAHILRDERDIERHRRGMSK